MTKINIKERTLVLLKPDALQRGIVGEIIDRFEQKGLKLAGLKLMKLSEATLNAHYAEHKGKPFFKPTKQFMQWLPIVAIAIEGHEAQKVVRAMCGPTDGKNAPPGTIRGDYSMSVGRNIIHSSADLKSARRELKIFFTSKELFDYKKADEHFYYSED